MPDKKKKKSKDRAMLDDLELSTISSDVRDDELEAASASRQKSFFLGGSSPTTHTRSVGPRGETMPALSPNIGRGQPTPQPEWRPSPESMSGSGVNAAAMRGGRAGAMMEQNRRQPLEVHGRQGQSSYYEGSGQGAPIKVTPLNPTEGPGESVAGYSDRMLRSRESLSALTDQELERILTLRKRLK